MKKILTFFTIFVLFIIFLFFSIHTYTNAISKDLSDSFFRLHILANSDSEKDQELKLKVRDNILAYMDNQNFKSKKEAISYVKENLNAFYEIAEKTIEENGYDYSVTIEIRKLLFPN